jgi:hypothetical protein
MSVENVQTLTICEAAASLDMDLSNLKTAINVKKSNDWHKVEHILWLVYPLFFAKFPSTLILTVIHRKPTPFQSEGPSSTEYSSAINQVRRFKLTSNCRRLIAALLEFAGIGGHLAEVSVHG